METLKKIWKAIFTKQLLSAFIGAIIGALGVSLKPEVIESLVCLLGAAGCE